MFSKKEGNAISEKKSFIVIFINTLIPSQNLATMLNPNPIPIKKRDAIGCVANPFAISDGTYKPFL